jgi:TruD family tRNA pseudouridine synthase
MSSIEETNLINKLKEQFPEKFSYKVVVENDNLLKKFGINIPGKENFSEVFLKMFPQDFIVEEIDVDNILHSVSKDETEKSGNGRYVGATLVKCGMSTLEVVHDIASKLNIDSKNISYAGIKDKKAITSQKIVLPGKFKDELSNIKSDNYFIKDIHDTLQPLSPGNLKANQFTILLRTNEKIDIQNQIKYVKENGFKNFYYLQRFGSPRLLSQKYGYYMVKGLYDKLIESVLFEKGIFEIDYFLELREKAKKEAPNWSAIKEIYKDFPTILKTEHRLLDALIKNDGNAISALCEIRDQTQMWAYAFASLLFNNLASVRDDRTLPLCLTLNSRVHELYKDIYKIINIQPDEFKNIKDFPFINLTDRKVDVFSTVEINDVKVVEGLGVVLQFVLPKGAYATTLLSNFVDLVSAREDVDVNRELVDIKAIIGDNSFAPVFEMFKNIAGVETEASE